MPEGPELARSRDQLREKLVGKFIHEIIPLEGGRYGDDDHPITGLDEFLTECNTAASQKGQQWMNGQLIKEIGVKGKFMWWSIGDDWHMWCTYGMSGQWSDTYDPRHSAVQVAFNDSGDPVHPCTQMPSVNFNDPRHFGTIKLVKGREALDTKLSSMCWDFLEKKHSTTAIWWFLKDTRKSLHDKPIGVVLMDQSIFPGIGNYIRAETLFEAKVSPWKLLKDVTYDELDAICKAARQIMLTSYESGGATILTYRDANGEKGNFSSRFAMYGRKQALCGHVVKKEKTPDSRTIHWCETCQK